MTVEEIKQRKKELGYSTEHLASLAGIPVGTLQKILNGQTKTPRYATLQALEKILKPEPAGIVREDTAEYGTKTKTLKEKKPGEFTVSDYYALPDEPRVELIDGEFYEMETPSSVHQDMLGEMLLQIGSFIRKNKKSCKVIVSPVDVRLDEDDKTMVQPDLMIVFDSSKIRRWGIFGAPEFILEIVSKSSNPIDYITKANKYLAAGVHEYWMLDPDQKTIVVYQWTDKVEDLDVHIGFLTGKHGIGLFNDELLIDLDELAAQIRDYPE